ncbi:RDD family protein [Rubrivirga sp. S365]|uniref:RDD family protein n=1 Tax=Rubrivirga litoralis TaxID=3075598 RepID=A0ABU3BSZ4_9BACT|nr:MULTISPECIES: RDD family protein [unclassified Rubrivirga]MDT0632407.1 RDD family protein [Rubrivirga sp. F394]MDT7855222.1 RDD family protein [Rubrivirga sp. S365]
MATAAPVSAARPVRVRRFAAAFLDGALALTLALVPAALTPGAFKGRMFGVGLLLGAAYLLLRDGLPYAEWGPRSLGKRWLGLRPYCVGGAALTWEVSARRNATVGGALAVWALIYLAGGFRGIPFGGFLLWAAVAVVVIEAVLVAIDPVGRRLGDRIAQTRVVEARA